jgi:hypothetical protein
VPSEALERLRQHARKRLAGEHHPLLAQARRTVDALRLDDWLVPEAMSLGYHTPYWEALSEQERLACNHWIYVLMYTRICEGEEYVINANLVFADAIAPHEPQVADLLRREAAEEVDHIASFRAVRQAVLARHGVDRPLPTHAKLARGVLIHPRAIRALIRAFGADFLVTYFGARGIANHMGKAFEQPVGATESKNRGARELSLLHTIDESQHMAVSHLLSACGREVLPLAPRRGRALSRLMQRTTIGYTFSEKLSKGHEEALTWSAVRRLPALAARPRWFLRELVRSHFTLPHGIERSRNASMPRLNARLIEAVALPAEDRELWRRTLVRNQGNLRFLPEGPAAA